jgi:Coenzyme PQQ synthesis protein D (PqqD)
MPRNSGEAECGLSGTLARQRFVRTRSVVSRVIAGETLIVPVRGKVGDLASIYSFNGTGTLLWQLLDAPRSLAELVDAVEHEYDVAREQAEKDVTQFLNDLALMDLLETPTHPTQFGTQIRRAETTASGVEVAAPAEDSQGQPASMAR